MSFTRIEAHDPRGQYWQGYEWTWPWAALEFARPPAVRGIYRVMAGRQRRLLYIGISGTLDQRLGKLRRGVMLGKAVSHPAAPAVRQHGTSNIRISWVEVKIDPKMTERENHRELYGIEAELIAAYRAALHDSPLCQWSGVPQPDEF